MNWSENNVMKRLLKEKILSSWEARAVELSCVYLLPSFVRSWRPCCSAGFMKHYHIAFVTVQVVGTAVWTQILYLLTHMQQERSAAAVKPCDYTEWSRITRNGPSRKRVVLPLLWLLESLLI